MLQGEMVMKGSGSPAMPPMAPTDAKPETDVIDTRFGKVTVYRKNPILFPNGILGMPDRSEFCLTNFPSPKMARFKMLQSLEDDALSFITLPIDNNNPIFDAADLAQAAQELNIPAAELTVLLIVSVHRESSGVRLSVNARAPLLVNAMKRTAVQHVFASSKYNIRHMLAF